MLIIIYYIVECEKKLRKLSVWGIKKRRSVAVRGGAPPGSASIFIVDIYTCIITHIIIHVCISTMNFFFAFNYVIYNN